MPQAEHLARRASQWIFGPEDVRRLASVRIGLCTLLALRLATADYRRVASQPAALFQPIWYMRLFQRMPSQGITTSLEVCGVVAALVAATGLAVRASLTLALGCTLVLDGMLNSTGRVVVGDAVLVLCLVVLLASGRAAAEAWTVRSVLPRTGARVGPAAAVEATAASARYGWPIRTAMATISLSVFFAGVQKLRYSGLAWITSDNLRRILYASSDRSVHPNSMALFVAGRPWLAHACAAGTLLLETCFPLALFVPKLRWPLIAGVVAMHEAIRLMIGLDYSVQALTVLVVFVDWPLVVAWLRMPARHGPATASQVAGPLRRDGAGPPLL